MRFMPRPVVRTGTGALSAALGTCLLLAVLTPVGPSGTFAAGGPEDAAPSPAVQCHTHADGTHECHGADHQVVDAVDLDSAQPVAAAVAAAVVPPADRQRLGTWSDPQPWPVVGVHLSLLADGTVLAWDAVSDTPSESEPVHDRTRAIVFDPAGATTRHDLSGHNIFCAGFAKLPDGRVLVAGGNADSLLSGTRTTDLFSPSTRTWSAGPTMAEARWYPSVTPLGNGEMLITGGGPAISEVYQSQGTLRRLTAAPATVWANRDYPWLQTAPNGKVAFLGPRPELGTVDTAGTGSWTPAGTRDAVTRIYGSYALYDARAGKALVSGGNPGGTSAVVVDTVAGTAQPTGSMATARSQHMLTILPDGSVLATGGVAGTNALVDLNATALAAERWNPATGTWATLAAQTVPRQYHSSALLLPDGRVLSAGGGLCGPCAAAGYLEKNYEIFTPPYLYRSDSSGELAARPVISTAPGVVTHGQTFAVSTPQAADIASVALIRLGSATHAQDQEQRRLSLPFQGGSGSLQVTAPASGALAPPGHYMLFLLDGAGVPSVAKILRVDPTSQPGTGTGLAGSYFAGRSLSGSAVLTRTEAPYFSWGTAAPGAGVGADDFSVRWSGFVEAPASGSYRFSTVSDDGVRLRVNGATVIDNWTDHGPTRDTGAVVSLTAGQRYPVVMEFYENGGGALAQLEWTAPGASGPRQVPVDRLYAAGPAAPQGLSATYYPGQTLSGTPLLQRVESPTFDWGLGGPTATRTDDFSARWTGYLTPARSGAHRFTTRSDDGVRLRVNGVLVIDNWTDHGPTVDTSAAMSLDAGMRYPVTMEFYEAYGHAVAELGWIEPGATSSVAVPPSRLAPS